MKIIRVTATPLNVPLHINLVGVDRQSSLSSCYVEVETDTGIAGHGFTAITEEDVVAKLGRPSAMSALLPDGSHSITYSYSRLQMSAASYLPVVSALAGETNASVTLYNFTFDAGHRLVDWNSTLKKTTDKMGLLNQQTRKSQ